MLTSNVVRSLALCLGVVVAHSAMADEPAKRIKVNDVALSANGQLEGKVVNKQGEALGGQPIVVLHDKTVVARALSDKDGKFVIRKLRGGSHIVQTNKTAEMCRFWTSKVAPPAASKQILLISDGKTVRAQYDNYSSPGFFSPGVFATGGIATAGILGAVWGFNHGLDNDSLPTTTVVDSSGLTPVSP